MRDEFPAGEVLWWLWLILCSGVLLFHVVLPTLHEYVTPGLVAYMGAG